MAIKDIERVHYHDEVEEQTGRNSTTSTVPPPLVLVPGTTRVPRRTFPADH